MNRANSPLPGDAIGAMVDKTRSTLSISRPRDKEPHLAPGIACLLFGAAMLKSAQEGRDSTSNTVPRKSSHSRASNSRFHASIRAETHAAVVEEAR
jgi:hypothetical protein